MKTIKLITALFLTLLVGFTSCQSDEMTEVGENPNANSSTSETAKNYERTSKNDGSEDDFLDDNSCTKVLFPVTTIINGEEITLVSDLDYEQVLSVMGKYNNDDDTVVFQFPIKVRLSNYTEVTVVSQANLDALRAECESAQNQAEEAVSCININFPITMFTYNVNFEKTGTVILQSEKQLFTFMNDLNSDELFSVNYPFNAVLSDGTAVQIGSDIEFKEAIATCSSYEEEQEQAEETADEVEAIVSTSKFKVESYVKSGIETANEYADYTIEFTNNLQLIARNKVNTTTENIEGTYSFSSELEVFLNIFFSGNTTFSALNNDWIISTYSNTFIVLKSKTDASVTLKFVKI